MQKNTMATYRPGVVTTQEEIYPITVSGPLKDDNLVGWMSVFIGLLSILISLYGLQASAKQKNTTELKVIENTSVKVTEIHTEGYTESTNDPDPLIDSNSIERETGYTVGEEIPADPEKKELIGNEYIGRASEDARALQERHSKPLRMVVGNDNHIQNTMLELKKLQQDIQNKGE